MSDRVAPTEQEVAEGLRIAEAYGDSQAIIDAARAAGVPQDLDPDQPQILIIPAGSVGFQPDLSAWRQAPVRATGVYRPATVHALTTYVEWQSDKDQTTIWVDPSGKVEAIIDDNGDKPGYREHRALLQLAHTPEWDFWLNADGTMMSQEDFAFHVESGMMEVTEPAAADLLELAQSFYASNNATFRSSVRLADGQTQFQYDQELEAKAGRTGQLQIPAFIELLISPFIGEDAVRLVARFRYRLTAGRLTLGYQIERPDKVVRDAIDNIADQLAAEFDHVFIGSAPSQ